LNRLVKIQSAFLCLSMIFAMACSGGGGSDPSMQEITKNKLVIIGTHAVDMPFAFGKGSGVQGFDIDIGNEIGKDIGYDVRWANIPFDQLFGILDKRELQMIISSVSITEERKAKYAFSNPYFTSGHIVATRRELDKIKSLDDLNSKRVGYQTTSTADQFISKNSKLSGCTKVGYATIDDALIALNNREIDAVIGDEPIISCSIFKSFPNLRTVGKRLNTEEYAIVLHKEDKALLAIVNKTLDRLKTSGKYKQFYNQWFSETERGIAEQKRKEEELAKLTITPKTILFNWVKDPGFSFKMSRLDGFTVFLKNNQTGQVSESTPIETSGNTGHCQIKVIPGQYSFSMKGYPLRSTVEVPLEQAMTLNSTINLGAQTTISPLK